MPVGATTGPLEHKAQEGFTRPCARQPGSTRTRMQSSAETMTALAIAGWDRGRRCTRQRTRARSVPARCGRAGRSRITGVALFGSAAVEREDSWSDVELAFGISGAVELQPTLADWTRRMHADHDALHHLDILSGSWVHRVFLFPSTLSMFRTGRTKCMPLAHSVATNAQTVRRRLPIGSVHMPRRP